ncbi:MAG: nucleotidyltransferase domain-containing protein [Caldisericia bacterium]|nr:nucleotidyltransferase domain-containing protein [Caldisericia bacterium]
MNILNFIYKEKSKRKKLLEKNLKKILNELKKLGALEVYLFGSFLKGNINLFSDLDLFIIMPEDKSGKEWSKIIYEKIEKDVAVDFIIFNKKEFEDEKYFNPLIKNILENGKLIYSNKN